jgi:hypothetical protein
MHPCNRGETPTRSVHENAAKRRAATTTRPQFCERAELFIGVEACDNGGVCASYFPGGSSSFDATQKRCEDASRSKALRAKYARAIGYFAKTLWMRSRPCATFIIIPLFWCQVRLWSGRQHHDWSLTLSMLRVRGPFRPISRFRSMGPDPTGPGSNGDVQDDASTPGSCRDQTLGLLR